jgi:hypothetical protein
MNSITRTGCTRAQPARSAITSKLGYLGVAALAMLVWASEEAPMSPNHLAMRDPTVLHSLH